MKVSDYVMNFLYDNGIRHIFGYQGGSVIHLIDSLHKVNGLTYIQNYHEQASAFSADAYSRVCGNIGAAIATSGPGATNLITGIASAFFDSVPCLFITGQVSTHLIKARQEIRQQSFQETDIVSLVKPITKFAKTIVKPETIRFDLEKALFCAKSGRPGSVLIDIPHNVQASEIEPRSLQSFYDSDEYTREHRQYSAPDVTVIRQVAAMLSEANRPVVLAGGGMAAVRDTDVFKSFVHTCDLPVVCSLLGLDAIDHADTHYSGFIGSYGNRYANFAVAKSDLLLVLGSRLDERQTGGKKNLFASGAKIIHVDIDPHVLNLNVKETLSICCDVKYFLNKLTEEIGEKHFNNREWLDSILMLKARYPSHIAHSETECIDPNEFINILSEMTAKNAVVCTDVGQNMMWVAQSFYLSGNKRFLSPGGHGAMGYSLPAGIGAYFAASNRQIICIMGDGGIQMNLQELQTVSREHIPIKIFVLNNSSLGMIRGFHEKYFNNKCFGSVKGFTNPDFGKIANAYNIAYTRISNKQDFNKLNDGLNSSSPHFFEVMLSPLSQIIPEPTAPMRAVEDQFPLLDRDEFNNILNS